MKTSHCSKCGAPYEWDNSTPLNAPKTCEFCGADLWESDNKSDNLNSVEREMESRLESFEVFVDELPKDAFGPTCYECPRCHSTYIAILNSTYGSLVRYEYPEKKDLYESRCLDCNAQITWTGDDDEGNHKFEITDFDSGVLSRIKNWLKNNDILHENEIKFNEVISDSAKWIEEKGQKIGILILIAAFFISFFILRSAVDHSGAGFMAVVDSIVLLFLAGRYQSAYNLYFPKFNDEPNKDSPYYPGPNISKESFLKKYITYFIVASILPLTPLIIWAHYAGAKFFWGGWFWCLLVCSIVFFFVKIGYFKPEE